MGTPGRDDVPELRPTNMYEAPVHVRHADLTRLEGSTYRSACPVCKSGILLVRRHQETLALEAEDNCISCGQSVIYDDIEEMRRKDGF